MPIPFRPTSQVKSIPQIPWLQFFLFRRLKWVTSTFRMSRFETLKWIYRYLNNYSRFVSTFSVCMKGCSHCCSIDIYISTLEAAYISEHTKKPYNTTSPYTRGHTTPCPFLASDGACSIYDYRPFNCRTFHTLDDPQYCASGNSHAIYGASSMGYGSTILAELAHAIDRLNNGHPKKDIRDFF